jgi:hypothetical protein
MISDLRTWVTAALEAAGYRNSEHHLPVHAEGGCFGVIGGDRTGCNVVWDIWDGSEAELAELRDGLARALADAGITAETEARRIWIPPPDEPAPGG